MATTALVLLASRTIFPTARAFAPSPQQLQLLSHRTATVATATVSRRSFSSTIAMSAAAGPRQTTIEERLNDAFEPVFLDVQNTSHGQKSDESHFKVVVVSERFEGTRLVGRHRAINKAVSESDGSLGFHSLEIGAAKTPEEWNKNSNVAPSPKCQGGDGRGMKN
eukprot:CAMPEP_0201123932 /NCGR_PEP_ID=MMETSP0850-20130426/9328_1 /ASSEMBLY_ACC=CAM_ASM_000622 /TAXON_ID=183588 /ORGANISM="Pseudo-nitzschia fraudulenta, Strain WWA7" /LENGTH=164 /DNA_ID=CAMNT_0047391053 /DNA_START=133 /DNA_END=627 /DNA_ORIENTATION=+